MASLAHLKLLLELVVAVVPEVAPEALAVVVVGPWLEKASLEGPSQGAWVVQAVVVALAEPTPSAGVQAASDPSPLPHCCWPEAGRFSSVASEGDPSQSSDGLSEGLPSAAGVSSDQPWPLSLLLCNLSVSWVNPTCEIESPGATSSPTVESGWCCPRGVRVTRP